MLKRSLDAVRKLIRRRGTSPAAIAVAAALAAAALGWIEPLEHRLVELRVWLGERAATGGAVVGGVGLAVLFNQSRLIEYSLYPYAVILQVTPIVAIAPLLLIYLPQQAAVLACAWIVAFFPVLANTTLGLNSIDRLYSCVASSNSPCICSW